MNLVAAGVILPTRAPFSEEHVLSVYTPCASGDPEKDVSPRAYN